MKKVSKPRGFAVMPRKDVKRICSMGGKACHMKYGSAYMARIGAKGGAS